MSIGSSGRIVIEIEPEIKRRLYSRLAIEGISLKEWFLREANLYVDFKGCADGCAIIRSPGQGEA